MKEEKRILMQVEVFANANIHPEIRGKFRIALNQDLLGRPNCNRVENGKFISDCTPEEDAILQERHFTMQRFHHFNVYLNLMSDGSIEPSFQRRVDEKDVTLDSMLEDATLDPL